LFVISAQKKIFFFREIQKVLWAKMLCPVFTKWPTTIGAGDIGKQFSQSRKGEMDAMLVGDFNRCYLVRSLCTVGYNCRPPLRNTSSKCTANIVIVFFFLATTIHEIEKKKLKEADFLQNFSFEKLQNFRQVCSTDLSMWCAHTKNTCKTMILE
jgi:hypothetical protein